MKFIYYHSIVFLIFALFSRHCYSSENLLIEIFKNYKRGNYAGALLELNKITGPRKILSMKFYMTGLCHNRLENYEDAIENLKKSAGLKNTSKDLYYELAQALYANNQLELALLSFKKSFKKKFKTTSTLYYMAYIYQLLEKYKSSNHFYFLLLKNKKTDTHLRQVSRLYIAENYIKMSEKRKNSSALIFKYALPQLNLAIQEDETSQLADDIDRRKQEVTNLFKLGPNALLNGKKISAKRWAVTFNEKFKYDNNITFTSDLPSTKATQKDSYVALTTFTMNYQRPLLKKIIINPALSLSKTGHTRKDPEVIVNDENSINASLNVSYEHLYANKQASLKLTYEYKYTERDRNAEMNKIFSGRTKTIKLSETFNYFSVGESNLALSKASLTSYDGDLHSKTNSYTFSQYFILNSGHFMLISGGLDSAKVIDISNNSKSYYTNLTYIIPNIGQEYTLALSLSLMKISTEKQKTKIPAISLSKKINHFTNIGLNYEYTSNSSETEGFAYKKHLSELEINLSF